MDAEHALGRLYAPDPRDSRYPLRLGLQALPPPVELPVNRYWRVGRPVLDQNGYPHCVAYAWKQWLMASPLRQGHKVNEEKIYREAQLLDEWPGENYDGTSVRAGAKVLQQRKYISNYLWATTIAEVKQWILAYGPVVAGTNWYAAMSNPYLSKRGETYGYWVKPEGALLGGHAFALTGYSLIRKAFRGLNSWGLAWGEEGKFWIAEEHLEQLMLEDGEVCTATELKILPNNVV